VGLLPLPGRYRSVLLDLDGVLYRGDEAISGAAEAVRALRGEGRAVVFLTNNSSRTPAAVAGKLTRLGIEAAPEEVVTSAMATAAMLEGAGTAFVIGEEGVREALAEVGVTVVDGEPERVDAVVVGWDRSADYDAIRVASLLVRRGARLLATNTDASYPAPGGELWPGAGALVAAVETATGVRAAVGGKPRRPLFDAALERAGVAAGEALMVGDRLETDVVGAVRAGIDAAVVFSGAGSPRELLDHDELPVAAMPDAGGLAEPRPRVRFRPAGPRDEGTVRGLLSSAGLEGEGPMEEAVVGEDDGRAVATASAAVGGETGYLHSVTVDEEVRGRSVGMLAVAAAARRAAGAGARELLLVTEDAAGFFARMGFDEDDRGAFDAWVRDRSRACSSSATAMRRSLA